MSRISEEEINRRLLISHKGVVTIVPGSFKGMNKKALFYHQRLGEWSSHANSVINQGSNHPKTQWENMKWSQKEFEIALEGVHGGRITIIWDSWVGVREKAIFVDNRYGEFPATPDNVLRGRGHPKGKQERIQNTHLERYGVKFPSQNKNIALKTAKKLNDSVKLSHWRTMEEIICRASYEVAVVNHLNLNKVDYLWQPEIFKTPLFTDKGNSCTYCPDLFLVNENKWIEVKGWMRPDAKLKWDWFQSEYPNSELWDKKKLKEIGIL